MWWRFTGASADGDRAPRLVFTDEMLGLTTTLCYETVPGTDRILRWTDRTDLYGRCRTAPRTVRLGRPEHPRHRHRAAHLPLQPVVPGVPAHPTRTHPGRFELAGTQAVPGHAYAPWLAVQAAAHPAEGATPTYGIALEWPGSWHMTADAEPGGAVRVRAGRLPHEGAVRLAPGATLTTPGSPAPSARTDSKGSPASGTATKAGSPASGRTGRARCSTTPGRADRVQPRARRDR